MLDVTRLRVIDAVARHGSVTAAAKELHYSQPSVSHHIARLEAETGAQLLQRVGRGIRLTQAGELLADRAAEIIGRIDAADAELSAHVGLTAGRVRLAGFSSAIGSLVPRAVAALTSGHPDLQITLTDTHPPRRWSCCAPARSTSRSSSATTRPSPSPTTSACTTCSTIRCTCSRPAEYANSPRCATRRGSPAANGAAATCCRCAPTRALSRVSATPPMTWS
jgi:molybdate transport repressor ModE-like protein